MSLFHRRRDAPAADAGPALPSVAGLADFAAARDWQQVSDRPFDGHLEDAVHEIARVMYGAPRTEPVQHVTRVGPTIFRDAFRTSVDARAVTVANGWTNIQPELRFSEDDWRGVAVCAVELPSILPIATVHPRSIRGAVRVHETPTGNPAFDERYVVGAAPGTVKEVLTLEVQELIMARDDWFFQAERYLFGCVSKGAFASAEEIDRRIDDVLAIVAAIPTSVMPQHVEHSADDLVGRISRLTSLEEAMAMLHELTPAEREQLAQSDSPLAAFADVRTPQDAMARFKTLDSQTKMQLMATFMRVKDAGGAS
jgi:hypothetical protein